MKAKAGMFLTGFHCPPLYVPCLGREVHSDFKQLSIVVSERKCIPFIVDLPEYLFGRSVQLELHDINVAFGLQNEVDPPVRGVVFHMGVKTY